MQVIAMIIGLVIGIILFLLLNEMFNVYYFGCTGVTSTFVGCWSAGYIAMLLLGMAAKWLVIIGVIIWILVKIFEGKEKKA
ncbi:hypothetical protein [Clostridium sp. CMCC3677]|uniref:hypothetical protein n=1 Tax=Clostridium sp. CMCC3677 TaxID=2949963 RepID=UPI0013F0DC3F|nr:hypothetical protein [Clostridium sp. CMCC3677]NFG61052.1 hypothetical protein [Clostridium botulinum]NFQ09363.1 hypothetical protein [Clostridium botulinum]